MKAAVYDVVVKLANEAYGEMLNAGVREVRKFSEVHELYPCRVLEIGIGTGTQMKEAIDAGVFCRLEAVDPDKDMMAGAKSKIGSEFATYVQKGAEEYVFGNEGFDVCLANQVFHYMASEVRVAVLKRILGALRRPGLLVYGDRVIAEGEYFGERYVRAVSAARDRIDSWAKNASYFEKRAPDLEYFRYDEREQPASMSVILDEIHEAGFKEMEVVWKVENYMVVSAIRDGDLG